MHSLRHLLRTLVERALLTAILVAASLVAGAAGGQRSSAPDESVELEQLKQSLETSCLHFTGNEDAQWAQADACRRAWFKSHEEAIWRLKLNPHAPPIPPPS